MSLVCVAPQTYHAGVSTPDPTLRGAYLRVGARLFRQALCVVGDPAAAEDLVHEAFSRLLDRGPDSAPVEDADAYLIRTVRNLALNHLRRRRVVAAHQREALRALEALVARGFEGWERVETDPAFAALRELPGYRALVEGR